MWVEQFDKCVREGDTLGALLVVSMLDLNTVYEQLDDSTPLIHCVSNNMESLVPLLIELGADVDIEDPAGCTALNYVSIGGHLASAKSLIAAGAYVDHRDNDHWTPLHLASWWNQADMVKFLLESGADTKLENAKGQTARDIAIKEGCLRIVDLLTK